MSVSAKLAELQADIRAAIDGNSPVEPVALDPWGKTSGAAAAPISSVPEVPVTGNGSTVIIDPKGETPWGCLAVRLLKPKGTA